MRVQKPPTSKKSGPAAPKLQEYEYIEIGERIREAIDFNSEVEVTIYHNKQHEKFVGVITSADSQTGKLKMRVNYNEVTIRIDSIIGVK